jgi:GTP-binding protein Era
MTTRCGFVALIGEPNAGKSTLLNAMVGAKVSIVTHKVQTTRARIRGVAMEGDAQIVFVDTPGLFRPRRRLDRAMVAAAWGGAADADVVVLLIEAHRGLTEGSSDPRRVGRERPGGARGARHQQDRPGEGEVLLKLSAEMNDRFPFAEDLHDLRREGPRRRRSARAGWPGEMPEGPWLYPEDQIADLPMRMIAAEITREKLTLRLHQELPYQLTVETENWEERKDGSARIDQVIYVARDGHKGIVLGKKGETIKAVARPRAPRSKSSRPQGASCSCRSRSGPAGWKRPSATPRWGSISRTAAEAGWPPVLGLRPISRGSGWPNIPAYVVARGDATAGAVLVKLRPARRHRAGASAQSSTR